MKVKGYYYKDKDQVFSVSPATFKDIQKKVAHGLPIQTGGHTLYPILDAPTDYEIKTGKTRIAAWLIRDGSTPAVRWYWQIQEHNKAHATCRTLGDGLCGFKMVRYANWNETSNKWELEPMVNHADPEQEKVLDSSY